MPKISTTFIVAALVLLGGAGQAYTLKQQSFRARDGTVLFACVRQPFEGTIAFVPSLRFSSGIAAIVTPASNYETFLRRRFPTPWYAAAETDISRGDTSTPAARLFERETQKVPTVMFQAEGSTYGDYERPHLPLDGPTLDAAFAQVETAISNCRLGR